MSTLSITDALGECITASGGTPTAEDTKSVSHALGTLYESLGGTDTLVNDVAQRVSSLSAVIGGSLAYKTAKVNVANGTSAVMNIFGYQILTDNGEVAVTINSLSVTKNATREMLVPVYRSYYVQDPQSNAGMWDTHLLVRKTAVADPTKVVVTATEGSATLLRNEEGDTSTQYAFVLLFNGVTATNVPTITISVTE